MLGRGTGLAETSVGNMPRERFPMRSESQSYRAIVALSKRRASFEVMKNPATFFRCGVMKRQAPLRSMPSITKTEAALSSVAGFKRGDAGKRRLREPPTAISR